MIRTRLSPANEVAPRAKPFGDHGALIAIPLSALLWTLLIASIFAG